MTSTQPAFRDNLNKQFVGGTWRDGGGAKQLADTNPYDGSPVADRLRRGAGAGGQLHQEGAGCR
jgi:hypothetical protein